VPLSASTTALTLLWDSEGLGLLRCFPRIRRAILIDGNCRRGAPGECRLERGHPANDLAQPLDGACVHGPGDGVYEPHGRDLV
jgi:hypothetical protein